MPGGTTHWVRWPVTSDHVEVDVVVEDSQAVQLRCGRDEKVGV
jgi:hypothetical protein